MPIYEYECTTCGTTFELMHSVNAKPPRTCQTPACKGKPKRLVSASGFILKGSGWYATDYPSESRKKGWEQESSQGKPEAPAALASAESPAPSPAPEPAPKPAAPAKAKNPYSGGAKKSKPAKKTSK